MKIFLFIVGFILLYWSIGFGVFILYTIINKGEDDDIDCPTFVLVWPFLLTLVIIFLPFCAFDKIGKKIQKTIKEQNETKEE